MEGGKYSDSCPGSMSTQPPSPHFFEDELEVVPIIDLSSPSFPSLSFPEDIEEVLQFFNNLEEPTEDIREIAPVSASSDPFPGPSTSSGPTNSIIGPSTSVGTSQFSAPASVVVLSPPTPTSSVALVSPDSVKVVEDDDEMEEVETEIFYSDTESEAEIERERERDTPETNIKLKDYSAYLSTEMGTVFRSSEVMQPMALSRSLNHMELISRWLNSSDMAYLHHGADITILTGGPFPSVNGERYDRFSVVIAEVPIPLAWLLGLDKQVVVGSKDQMRTKVKERVGLLRQALTEYFECQRGRETDDQLTDAFMGLIKISSATFLS